MGRTKQLLLIDEKPVIRHCIDALQAARITEIVVVVTAEDNGIVDTLRGLPLIFAVNTSKDSDMAESVKAGLTALSPSTSGVLICLSDHPLVRPETIEALITEHLNLPDKIVIPCYNGRRGHPSLFPKSVVQDLRCGGTLRDIIRKEQHRVVLIDTGDEGVVLDMDTPEEFNHIVETMRKKHT
ncbi:MAG TPA: nucleotidyltransferase family protein [Nitrospirota bacterium]|nr:nucleotidyltransferase family protein [Nitrospirota bacterium]